MDKDSLNNKNIGSDKISGELVSSKDFQYYWDLEGNFIEEINRSGKDGWSGVIVGVDKSGTGECSARKVCIKKQENYFSYSSINFIRGRLTIENESRNLIFCMRSGLIVPEVIFSGKRTENGKRQGILVTQFLEGFTPLDKILSQAEHELYKDVILRRKLIENVACEVRKLHKSRIVHNNLYPKHIFIDCKTMQVAFIDFEKAKRKFSVGMCEVRDLEVLSRYSPMISRSDKLRFLKVYFGVPDFGSRLRLFWGKIAKIAERKLERKRRHSLER